MQLILWIILISSPLAVRLQSLEIAASDLINQFIQNQALRIDVAQYSMRFDMALFLKSLWSEKSLNLRISNKKVIMKMSQRKVKFLMMIFDDMEIFANVINNFDMNFFDVHGFYIIVFVDPEKADVDVIFETVWKKPFYNVNVLMQVFDGSIELTTFFPFLYKNCKNTATVTINRFVDNWESLTFFPNKLMNFHKCPLTVGSHGIAARFNRTQKQDGSFDYDGSDAMIIKLLSGALNFHMNVNYSTKVGDWGGVHRNGTTYGVMGQAIHGNSDMVIGTYFLQENRALFMDYTDAYFVMPEMVIVPGGAPFTSVENLLRPFSLTVWFGYIATLIVGYSFNILFNFLPKTLKVVISDRKNLLTLHDLCAVVFAEAVSKTPKRSPARFFLVALTMFCLVMRTVYLARMFDFFEAGHNKTIVKDFEDMAEREFKFFMDPHIEDTHVGKLNYPEQ